MRPKVESPEFGAYVQLISVVPDAPASVPQKKFPVVSVFTVHAVALSAATRIPPPVKYKPEEAMATPPWKVEVAREETVRLFTTFKSVAVAFVSVTVPKEDEALVKYGALTSPDGRTAKSEVVALPLVFVEEAMAKMGSELLTPVRWIENVANGVVVPMVKEVLKRFWSVEEAVAMMPAAKLIKVEVASQVDSVVNGKAKSDEEETLLLKALQSPAVKSPRTVAEEDGSWKVKVPATFVIPQSPEIAVELVASVSAPTCTVPNVCASERTPAFVNWPFAYESPVPAVVVAAA